MTLRDDLMAVVALENQLGTTFGLNRYTVTIRREVWSVAVGQGTITNTDTPLTDNPTVESSGGPTGTRGWFAGGVLADATGALVLAEFRIRRIIKPYTDPVTGLPGGYDLPTLLPAGSQTSRSLVILAGDGLKALASYAGGEPFLVLYADASDPFTTDLYLQRATALA